MASLFETIHYGGSSFMPIAVIIYGAIFICIVVYLAIELSLKIKLSSRNSKLEKELIEKNGERIACLDCPYCKKYRHRTFYTSDALSYWAPIYCRKLKIKFVPGQLGQKCQAKDPRKAMRKNSCSVN